MRHPRRGHSYHQVALTLENLQLLGAAAVILAIAAGMAFYEWTRIKAGKPIQNGHQAITLYWVAYLTLFVLGVTTAIAAAVR